MDTETARTIISNTNGEFFSTIFIKRTDGTERKMLARTGVSKGVKGVGLSYNPKDHDLVCVFDIQKDAHRMISLDSVIQIKYRKVTYK